VDKLWVTKLTNNALGNTLKFKIQFFEDSRLGSTVNLTLAENQVLTLTDDGTGLDAVANDRLYTAATKENTTTFTNDIQKNIENNAANGKISYYNGYTAMEEYKLPTFDFVSFNQGKEVLLDKKLTRAPVSCTDILKEKSLLITDLSVVEDPARTYNVKYETGNPTGAWTFGQMIKNMTQQTGTEPTKALLKNWLRNWMNDETVSFPNLPGYTVTLGSRTDALIHLIRPWIDRCNYEYFYQSNNSYTYLNNLQNTSGNSVSLTDYIKDANGNLVLDAAGKPTILVGSNTTTSTIGLTSTVNAANWEDAWDAIPENVILQYAPFRLMAISNRIDLRSNNMLLKPNWLYRGGETRFVFTLINVVGTDEGLGEVPIHINQDFVSAPKRADWEGMNVILEYGNSSASFAEEKILAQQWLELSNTATYPAFPLPTKTASNYTTEYVKSQNYNAALQLITDKVTKANADPRRVGNNKSAINQIRTNERIFQPLGPQTSDEWAKGNWELRQFEISPTTHMLERVNVTNVPLTKEANTSAAITSNAYNIEQASDGAPTGIKYNYYDMNYKLYDWVTRMGNNNIAPQKYIMANFITQGQTLPNGFWQNPGAMQVAPSAIMQDESYTYFDIWKTPNQSNQQPDIDRQADVQGLFAKMSSVVPSKISSTTYTTDEHTAKLIRHGLSIQTCQGCHGGDTKTMFTMIHPQGYGKTAIYWNGNPDYITKKVDARFEFNIGANGNGEMNNPQLTGVINMPVISSFITGIAVNRDPSLLPNDQDFNQDDWNGLNEDANDLPTKCNINNYAQQPPVNGLPVLAQGENKYYVNDPTSQNLNSFMINTNMKFGFNELDRRRKDLCILLNTPTYITKDYIQVKDIVKAFDKPVKI
jgi:hypothetical protein